MAVSRFPVVGGAIPLGPTETLTLSGWSLVNVCCVDQWRYVTVSGEMTLEQSDENTWVWALIAPGAIFDLPDGQRAYMEVAPVLFAQPGFSQFAVAAVGSIVISPSDYSTGVTVATATVEASFVPGPSELPDVYRITLWWDSMSPHDVRIGMEIGVGSPSFGPVGWTITGAESFLLAGNPAPLPDATFAVVSEASVVESVMAGSIQSWESGCSPDFTWDQPTTPFDPVVPPCTSEFWQDGFVGGPAQVASPPYLDPDVVVLP